MRKVVRAASLLLVIVLVFSFAACKRKQSSSGYWLESGFDEEGVTASEVVDSAKSQKEKSGGTANKGVNRDSNTWKIMRNVSPSASKSVKGTNFGGKTFRMLVWQENYSAQEKATIAAFEKAYNCKVSVDQINFEDYLTVLATSLSSGKPYDIVKTHNAFFPQAAISNIYQPMQKYVAKSDLVSSTNKTGIDWDKTMACATWSNNVYYLVDQRGSTLPVMLYNKLLFQDYGLEDAMSLYNKGKWTWDTIKQYAKIVSSAGDGKYFFDDTVSDNYRAKKNADYYTINNDGTVIWNGANTDMYTNYSESRKLRNLSPLSGETALVDNLVSGKAMLQVIEAEKLYAFSSSFKNSSAFGKSLDNVGVVPVPLNQGDYMNGAIVGYAACRGVDPSAAVAYTLFASQQKADWANSEIASLNNNSAVFESLYKKMSNVGVYMFLSASGQRISEAIYPMYGEIEKGGDIMKLLEDYSSKVKTILEYNFSRQ